jgi:hypothetical protein
MATSSHACGTRCPRHHQSWRTLTVSPAADADAAAATAGDQEVQCLKLHGDASGL